MHFLRTFSPAANARLFNQKTKEARRVPIPHISNTVAKTASSQAFAAREVKEIS